MYKVLILKVWVVIFDNEVILVDRRNMPVEDLIRLQLQSEEELTDQRSSYFKLCIALHFKSLLKKICPKL